MLLLMSAVDAVPGRWEHFPHEADVGIRGLGSTKAAAFEQAALALTAVVTNPATVRPSRPVRITCQASDDELLLIEWLNAIIYQMATRRMLFSAFKVQARPGGLQATAWGEPVEGSRHEPAVEIKGATFAELRVRRDHQGQWLAQCIVDV